MAVNKLLPVSYQGHLQNVFYSRDAVEETMLFELLGQYKALGQAISTAPPLLYLIDYTKSAYLVMTEAAKLMTSYDPRDFLDGGIEQLIHIFQKEDFKVYNSLLFPANLAFLRQQPIEKHAGFVFSYNFRVRNKQGAYVTLLQRGSYLTSPITGLPLYSLGTVTDITAFKKDNMIYHTIEEINKENILLDKKLLVENFFYPNEEDRILSKRERSILSYMSEGLSSKQIAWKLYISENTIANHRKNMLKKTNTKNVAQLITYACKNKII